MVLLPMSCKRSQKAKYKIRINFCEIKFCLFRENLYRETCKIIGSRKLIHVVTSAN